MQLRLRNLAIAAISAMGLSALISLEGTKLTAYQDGAGVWTICQGHTKGVYKGMKATTAQCEDFLRQDIKMFEAVVKKHVKVPLTQNQFDALVIFAFNVGEANFKSSTLLTKLNRSDYQGAGEQFMRWVMIRDPKTNELVYSKGLYNRRLAEQTLYFKE